MELEKQVRFPGGGSPQVALLVSLAVFLTGVLVGYFALSGIQMLQETGTEVASFEVDRSFWGILSQNLATALLLYSGVVTLGVSTLLGLGMTSAFVGATMAVAVTNSGWSHVVGVAWGYAPIEFAGAVVAAAAGLYPLVSAIRAAFSDREKPALLSTYLRGMVDSLKLLGIAIAMILTAAAIESIIIALE